MAWLLITVHLTHRCSSKGIQALALIGGGGGFAFSDQSAFATNGAITGLKIWINPNLKTIQA
jgi:hypothetical protein